jgi:hypothetical protein
MVDTVRGADFQSRGLLKALEVGETARAARALGLECSFLSSQGGKARARIATLLTQMKSACALLPDDPFMKAWSTGTEGIAHYLMGDFAEGAALLARAEEGFVEGTSGNAWEIATTRIFRCSIMRYAGRYADLAAMYHRHVPEAERRGDRYTEATVTRIASIIWLAADATEVCALDLDRRAWNPPEGSYHMQNWYEWRARSELAMYRRQPEVALASFEATWASLRRSKLARVQLTRTEALWLHGRLALAAAEQGKGDKNDLLAVVLRCAGKLEPEVAAYPYVWARLLRAGVAQQRGEREQVKSLLEEVGRLSGPAYLLACGAAAELALGRLIGGSEGRPSRPAPASASPPRAWPTSSGSSRSCSPASLSERDTGARRADPPRAPHRRFHLFLRNNVIALTHLAGTCLAMSRPARCPSQNAHPPRRPTSTRPRSPAG